VSFVSFVVPYSSSFADEPEDPRVTYNRAVDLAQQGENDKAAELYRQAAVVGRYGLAAKCHYNLGCLAADKARKLFGQQAETASSKTREEGLGLLTEAVAHLRDCIRLDPDSADARHNLETIRLWVKHMKAVWEERDRQKDRQESNMLEFLAKIEQRQRALREVARALAAEPDSPKRRQAMVAEETAQRTLADEIKPLKEKIQKELSQAASGAAQAAGPSPPSQGDIQKGIDLLTGLADESGKAMLAAADRIHAAEPAKARKNQAEALEKLDAIFLAASPYPGVVSKAVERQKALVDQTVAVVEKQVPAEQFDFTDAAWDQEFVGRWTKAMQLRAKDGLKELEKADPAAMAATPGPNAQPGTKPDPEAIKKQIEGLKKSMKKAEELGPKIESLVAKAVDHLEAKKASDARPKQEEALKLLKEIAEPLADQDQKQKQDQKQDQKKDQDDKKKQDEKKDQQQKQDEKKDQDQKQQQQQQPKPEEMSKEQAEALLRQVRQRQQDREQKEKQLQQFYFRPGKVEKDW
jgi:hypothetical protein